jgi:hypothetical protein
MAFSFGEGRDEAQKKIPAFDRDLMLILASCLINFQQKHSRLPTKEVIKIKPIGCFCNCHVPKLIIHSKEKNYYAVFFECRTESASFILMRLPRKFLPSIALIIFLAAPGSISIQLFISLISTRPSTSLFKSLISRIN